VELKSGYKQTDAGVIPEEWGAEALGHHVEIKSGESPSLFLFKNDGIPYFKVEQLNNNSKYLSDTPYFFLGDKKVPWNSLIFPKRGASILLNKVRILKQDAFMDTNMMTLTAKAPLDHEYLYYALTYIELWRIADTTSIPQINNKHIIPLVVPIPPPPEQRAIAGALSDVDELIDGLDQLIAKKRDLKQATMQQLLTGQTRLPGFETKRGYKQTEMEVIPQDWETATLSALSSMKSGEGITSTNIDQFSKYPCYGGNGLRGFTTRFTHDGRYALVGRQGALCGNVVGVEGKFFASEHAIVVTASPRTDIRWLTLVLGEMHLNQYSESSAQPGLSVSKILSLIIACPLSKAEQTAIAEVLSDMDAELAALEQRRDKTRALKQGMMQELLTGRIRLPLPDAMKDAKTL
jgi:type I restriction enzyme S subunit